MRSLPWTHTKANFTGIKNSHLKSKTSQFLEENLRTYPSGFGVGQDFFNQLWKLQAIKKTVAASDHICFEGVGAAQ